MNALVCMQAKKRRLHAVPRCGSDRLNLHFREGSVAGISLEKMTHSTCDHVLKVGKYMILISSSLCAIRCIIHKVLWTCIHQYVHSCPADAIDFSFSVNFRHHQDVMLVKSWPNLTFLQKYEERVTYRVFSVTAYAPREL